MIDDRARDGSCFGRSCDFNIGHKGVNCSSGSGSCFAAMLVPAHESEHHDKRLMEATEAINEILAKIEPDEQGRKLSLLATPWGAHLAWVTHGAPVETDSIPHNAPRAVLAKALNIDEAVAETSAD